LYFNYDFNDPNILTVSKGSICVNGVSLTIVESFTNGFSVVIIPYTWQNTNLGQLKVGDRVNIEFDLLGKYIKKIMENKSFF
jgi:riboflavin synthase